MDITVIKGNPTDDELTALTMVLADPQAAATNAQNPGERNLWGSHGTPPVSYTHLRAHET